MTFLLLAFIVYFAALMQTLWVLNGQDVYKQMTKFWGKLFLINFAMGVVTGTLQEFPLGTPAIAANFPRRNRIISGLARGVLVVEAALESGSLITARLAAEQGREVFAIPGSIHSPVARGCHRLIRQGAKLVETAQDILEELGGHPGSPHVPEVAATAGDSDILKALGHDPCALDDLVDRTGISADQLLGDLLTLELDGLVATLPGNRYQRLT